MGEVDFASYGVPAVGVLLVMALLVMASRDWRVSIAALGMQYVAVFVLVSASWQIELAVVKLVAGWMAAAILGATDEQVSGVEEDEQGRPSGVVFRILVGGMTALVVFSLAPETAVLIQGLAPEMSMPQVAGGLLLIAMGFVMLGLTASPLRVVLALLVLFSGFEIWFAAVEDATLVAGLLAMVNLALASIGSYLHLAPGLATGARE